LDMQDKDKWGHKGHTQDTHRTHTGHTQDTQDRHTACTGHIHTHLEF